MVNVSFVESPHLLVVRNVVRQGMYFCSVEHQKLIWPAHKRVCVSNPFQWPPLSQSEVDQYITLSTKQTPANAVTWTSWLEEQARPLNGSSEFLKAAFKRMLEEVGPSAANGPLSTLLSNRLVKIRSDAFSFKAMSTFPRHSPHPEEARSLAASSPFDFLAYIETKLVPQLALMPSTASFSSTFHHKYLIYNYILSICGPGNPERYEYAQSVSDDLKNFVEKEMKPSHPEEAANVLICLGMLVMGPFPVYKGE
ncbi:hypothetical protein JCM5353_004484 [Sporobolomyces roseus]